MLGYVCNKADVLNNLIEQLWVCKIRVASCMQWAMRVLDNEELAHKDAAR